MSVASRSRKEREAEINRLAGEIKARATEMVLDDLLNNLDHPAWDKIIKAYRAKESADEARLQ